MSKLKQVGEWLWYPWLFALFPIVFLYANNFSKVYADDFVMICLVAIVVVSLLMGLVFLIVKDINRAAAITSVVVIAFFIFGPIRDSLADVRPRIKNIPDTLEIVLPLVAVGLIAALAFIPGRVFRKVTANLNIVAAFLLLFNIGTLVSNEIELDSHIQSRRIQLSAAASADRIGNDSQHPDVYYIILDAYPSNASLMDESQIDNSAFTDGLEKRGFYVAYDSTSNYPLTLASLSSSLNMRYLVPNEGPDADAGIAYARSMIADSAVARQFQSYGYTYIFVMSGFDSPSTLADLNTDYYPDGFHDFPHGDSPPVNSYQISMWPLLVDSTILSQTDADLSFLTLPIQRPAAWSDVPRARATFDEAVKIAHMPQATFTVIHLMMPHQPIRVMRDGQEITGRAALDMANGDNRKQAFVDMLGYLNDHILGMVDGINSASGTPPIIIIQGDHGSLLGNHHPGGTFRYYRNLNAYAFPGKGKQAGLAQDITPVNSFRVLFNTYFGSDYDLLAPRHFQIPDSAHHLFTIVETKTVR